MVCGSFSKVIRSISVRGGKKSIRSYRESVFLVHVKRSEFTNFGVTDECCQAAIDWCVTGGGDAKPPLLIWNLRHNQISDVGAKIFADDFACWDLDTFHLEHNNITHEGKRVLLTAWAACGKPEADAFWLRGLHV